MASGGIIAGALTFSTALDNSDLEKGLEDAKEKVEELKEKLEKTDSEKSAIEQQLEKAEEAAESTKEKLAELREQMESLFSDTDMNDVGALERANQEAEKLQAQIDECSESLETQQETCYSLSEAWMSLHEASQSYSSRLQSAEAEMSELAQTVSSVYYQAGVKVRQSFDSMSTSVSNFANRVANLAQSALVFSVLTSAFNEIKKGIADALMQNEQFSASWTYLGATVQGFANGIANVVAPALVTVINGVTACIVTLARAVDAVFKTGLVAAIGAARKTSEEAWRQTDESKAAAKEAEKNAKASAKQDERYAKAQETQRKKEEAAAKRLAKAEESAAKRQAKAAEKYPDAVEKAAKRQEKAEKKMAERLADAEETAQERQTKATEKAAERQAKAEEKAQKRYEKAVESAAERQADAEKANADREQSAAERLSKAQEKAAQRQAKAEATAEQKNADAQAAYEEKVAAAEKKARDQQAKADAKAEKAAKKLEKAQKKANETVLGFDELNKMNADTSEEAAEALEDQTKATIEVAEVKPPKTYTVDPSDYFVDPSDYQAKLKEIDYSDYFVDPSEYAIDPSDYIIDPSDYAIDYDDYVIDPEDFFVDPSDYEFDPMDYWVDPSDYAVDALDFDWTDFAEISPTEGLKTDWDALDIGKIDAKLAELMAICSAALLAIGAILAFSGVNIPLGLALMAAGALGLATVVGENWDQLPAEVRNAITNALVLTGIVLIVLGAVLAFSNVSMPLGIGLIAAGAMLLWSSVALNWGSMTPEIQGVVTAIMGILSGALLVIGAIIAFADPDPTHKALGVGLMVLGAAGLAAAIGLNWASMDGELQATLTRLLVFIGTMAIVLGVVLLFGVPGYQALGVGLILTGVTALAAAVALNWNTMYETLLPVFGQVLTLCGTFCCVIGVILALSGYVPIGIGLIIAGAAMFGAAVAIDWAFMNGQLSGVLTGIMQALGPFFFVLGVILCLASPTSCPLGIALMIVGAAQICAAVALNWESMPTQLQTTLSAIMVILGTFLLVVGAILAFSGANPPLGIGLMAAGALALGTAAVLNWEWITQNIGLAISAIETALFGAAIVVGAILTFSSANAPLGLALMALGAAGMAMEASENWEKLPQDVQNTIATITAALSVAFLAIGAVLAFSGANIPLGIGLMILGAAGLATLATIDWNKMPQDVQNTVTAILTIASTALLVLGIVLVFTGAAAPLGLALIAAGAAGLATAVAINWDFIPQKISEIWKGVTQWWANGPAKIFTAQWWQNLFMCIPNAIVAVINKATEAFNSWIQGISDALGSLVGATGGSYSGGGTVSNVRPPGLARGAVIPPNREFMAILGDQSSGNNIETPESLMRQVVREEAGSLIAEMMMSMQGQQTDSGGGDITMPLIVDGETLAVAVSKGNASAARRGLLSPTMQFA